MTVNYCTPCVFDVTREVILLQNFVTSMRPNVYEIQTRYYHNAVLLVSVKSEL